VSELVPGTVIAGYRIEAVAGRGGMGVVYRATQLALQRQVALKVIAPEYASDPDFRARFKRESLTAAAIEHPNVIAVHDARDEDGVLFLTMRYVDGTDLRETIAREGRIEPHRAARIVSLVGSALDAAHAAGLVHRDIKPANILLSHIRGEEQVYLTDFGLTKQTSSESGMTKTGMFVGTVDYVAPEQLQGGPVDARTDIYSLGCVLYQALTGMVPYPRENDLAKLYAHGSMPPPSVSAVAPDLSPAFDGVVAKAMAKQPDDRYLSAGDLGRAAVAAAQGQALSRTERNVAAGPAAPSTPPTVLVPGAQPTAPQTGAPAPLATALGAPPPPYGGAPTAIAGGRQGRGRRKLFLVGGIATALVVAAVVVVLLLGGSSGKGTDPVAFAVDQENAADKYALSHYPGSRPIDRTYASCDAPDGGANVGGTIDCLLFAAGTLKQAAVLTLMVTNNHPFEFGSVMAGDCVYVSETSNRKRPCS
jgi:serine/threonine-protein kinase